MITETTENKNHLYPVFLKLQDLQLLLVGAGNVGLEKLQSLLSNSPNANIVVVAPVVRDELSAFVENFPNVRIEQRLFQESDLNNKDLAILATDNPALHKEIKLLAEKKHLLVNVADTPALCDFYLGSIVQKGSLKIAISTDGKSPTIAKRMKEMFNEMLPEEVNAILDNMQIIRDRLKGDFQEKIKQLNELTSSLVAENNNNK